FASPSSLLPGSDCRLLPFSPWSLYGPILFLPNWWDRIVLQVWDESQWLQNFCMRKGTFMELCELLSHALKRQDTRMRAALTIQKRVAIALWKLATPDSYRSVANQFGVGKSTVGVAVARAIVDLLLHKVVTLGDVQAIIDGFAAMGFPNCGGAIDGTHIPILGPEHQGGQYINRKGYFSMVLQALVDHKGRFTNINVGWPGKVHDARVFKNSGLFKRLQQGMPTVILGDPAYPLMPWLMKPYTGALDTEKELFNYRLSKCRMVVECAFGRLKARWRSLLTRSDLSPKNIPIVIAACCVLHNLSTTLPKHTVHHPTPNPTFRTYKPAQRRKGVLNACNVYCACHFSS
uniref:Putative nuclease HARBI1 n=1 Tax=Chelydra serpentina TaxID=8475 RepID=A0A8C3XM02_CHESE